MNNHESTYAIESQADRGFKLAELVRQLITEQGLDVERDLVKAVAAELNISLLDCAAAIAGR